MAYVFNPLSGEFDVVFRDGFLPYDHIDNGLVLRVPAYRQMNIVEEITVLGELTVEGSLNLLYDAPVWAYRAITADRILDSSDELIEVTANSVAVTLPTAVSFLKRYTVKNSGAGVVTLYTVLSQTIDGEASGVLTLNQYDSLTLRSNNANWVIV